MNSLFSIVLFSCLNNILLWVPLVLVFIVRLIGLSYFYINSSLSETESQNSLKYIIKNGYFLTKTFKESKIIPLNTVFICFRPFCIGYVTNEYVDRNNNTIIHMLLKKKHVNKITEPDSKEVKINTKKIKVYSTTGRAAWNVKIERTNTYLQPKFIPHKKLIKNIIDEYKLNVENSLLNNGYLGCLFFGEPGTGKTTIGYNIALELQSNIIINYDPTTRGLDIKYFLARYDFDKEKPLVIVINEFDKIVKSCFDETLDNKTEYFRDAFSKPTLNNLFDTFSMQKGLIIICSSNESLDWYFSNKYESVLRDGRINYKCEIGELSTTEIKELNSIGYECTGKLSSIKKKIKKN